MPSAGKSDVPEASVKVGHQPSGVISPRLYGHFAEHLGRCCYNGLWVGDDAPGASAVDGFRADVVAALTELPVPLLRWPGGCYADHYHWRDGIGAPESRPTTLNTSCGQLESDSNRIGTHEFMRLAELLDAEPYLAVNVGTGSIEEACSWVEYVNADVDTSLTRQRAANGHAGAWGVGLWGIGNETWDCGGRFDAAAYADEYRRYATMLRHIDPTIELVAVGMEDEPLPESMLDPDWNVHFLEALGPNVGLVDHLSIHRYWIRGGPETGFGEDDYYALLTEAESTESLIGRTAATLAQFAPAGRRPRVALDEFGVWHPEARTWGPGEVPRRSPVTFEQANTLRDAIAVAIAFEGFHRQCEVLSMANLAQVVNVLQSVILTDGDACVKTPTYHAYALHRPHLGAMALPVTVSSDALLPGGGSAVSATASARDGRTAVTIVNRDFRRAVEVEIDCPGTVELGLLLSADEADAVNTTRRPDRVAPRPLEVRHSGGAVTSAAIPAHSMATIQYFQERAG
jgi:alpha-N-arabinofuranosidase